MKSKFNIIFEQVMDLLLESIASDIEALEIPDESKSILKNLKDHNGSPDLKKQKAAIYWISKNILQLPGDEKLLDNALQLIGRKLNDYQTIKSKEQLESTVNSNKDLLNQIETKNKASKFDPAKEPTFSNPYNAGDGVVIYRVEDSKEAQKAVRKAIDKNWGFDANPWCLAARQDKDDEDLAQAWGYWKHYNAYPKRIAFKNGKLLAFCANENPRIAWWNRDDNDSINIPDSKAKDDYEFLIKYAPMSILEDRDTKPEILDRFADHENDEIRGLVANHRNTSAKTLKKLAEDKSHNIRAIVAYNPHTPVETLVKLAGEHDYLINIKLSYNQNTPVNILENLAKTGNRSIKCNLAEISDIPDSVAEILVDDADRVVKKFLAENRSISEKIMWKLSDDGDETVKACLVSNRNIPKEILEKLAKQNEFSVMITLAKNPNCTEELMDRLSENKNFTVREALAENPNCPENILDKLSYDPDFSVKSAVARNEITPEAVLMKLAKDPDPFVRSNVTRNPNVPKKILEILAKQN